MRGWRRRIQHGQRGEHEGGDVWGRATGRGRGWRRRAGYEGGRPRIGRSGRGGGERGRGGCRAGRRVDPQRGRRTGGDGSFPIALAVRAASVHPRPDGVGRADFAVADVAHVWSGGRTLVAGGGRGASHEVKPAGGALPGAVPAIFRGRADRRRFYNFRFGYCGFRLFRAVPRRRLGSPLGGQGRAFARRRCAARRCGRGRWGRAGRLRGADGGGRGNQRAGRRRAARRGTGRQGVGRAGAGIRRRVNLHRGSAVRSFRGGGGQGVGCRRLRIGPPGSVLCFSVLVLSVL